MTRRRARKRGENKAVFFGERLDDDRPQPQKHPASVAWRSKANRDAVLAFLRVDGGRGHRLSIPVTMASGARRVAVFLKVYRRVGVEVLVVAVDAETGTVYTGISFKRRDAC